MSTSFRSVATLLLSLSLATVAGAQTRPNPAISSDGILNSTRPIPGAVYESPAFTRAVARGTRTRTGNPGASNWVQHARYRIDAKLDPATNTVTGSEHVVYLNNSPDTLPQLMVHLRQNVFRPESVRRDEAPLTDGMKLTRVAAGGTVLDARSDIRQGKRTRPNGAASGYVVNGTVMRISLARPLMPHDSVALDFAWSYVPSMTPSDGREGRDDHLYFMGYWYPQIAVYDDVDGWVADQYVLQSEFYMDPADYDVRVTVPRGWVVGATGTLLNADSILSASARTKLAQARRTGAVVTISKPSDAGATFATQSPSVTWHFDAPNVRDFAWGTSDRYVWDATRALVADSVLGQVPDTVDIFSFYRISAPAAAWAIGGARFTRDAIQQLSKYLWKYPWPSMTSMEGVLTGGGMEYPRMTLMQPWADTLSLAGDLMHETGHMWFPMMVGSDETRATFMDEGFTQFDEAQGLRPLYGEPRKGGRIADTEQGQRLLYTRVAAAGEDQVLMTRGDLFRPDLYNIIFYDKTAQVLAALRGVLGEPEFHRAFRSYGKRWIGRHPHPEDFFNAMSSASNQDLSWFWNTWFYNAWPLDQAISRVAADGEGTAITIEDRGLAPMPVKLAITRDDKSVEHVEIPVTVWLKGARFYVAHVASSPEIVRVEIDPDQLFPDINRENQVWVKP
jgi:hypothetical protein